MDRSEASLWHPPRPRCPRSPSPRSRQHHRQRHRHRTGRRHRKPLPRRLQGLTPHLQTRQTPHPVPLRDPCAGGRPRQPPHRNGQPSRRPSHRTGADPTALHRRQRRHRPASPTHRKSSTHPDDRRSRRSPPSPPTCLWHQPHHSGLRCRGSPPGPSSPQRWPNLPRTRLIELGNGCTIMF
ncbi:MAG: hypothetical protein JWQ42_1648 [Edaphobacter sp.]|nr:hypothetical protein [Edaphobacter sp.]